MSLGINDLFTFGQYKGRKVSEVLLENPGYCAWLRDEKKRSSQPSAFDKDANDCIDVAIQQSSRLRGKHQLWHQKTTDLEEVLKGRTDAVLSAERAEEQKSNERQLAYADQWGAW